MRAASPACLWLGGLLMLFSAAALAENAVTTDIVSVHAGPDDSYPEVAQLDADTPIQVMGCLDDWSWCDVAFADDNRGWLYAPDITYEYEGGYVPFYTYAPTFGLPIVVFSIDTYWRSHYHDRPWYAQRDEWVHRPIRRERPPGPAPRREPPPRDVVRAERPHGGPRPGGEPMRLSKAPLPRPDEERGGSGPRLPEHTAPPGRPSEHPTPPPAERNARPPERAAPPPPTPEHAAPPPAERNARPPEHNPPPAAPQRAEPEPRKSEPAPKREGQPRKEDDNDRRG